MPRLAFQTSLQGFSLFCCHRDRLLPENIAHLCFFFFFFFFFSEYSLISSVFPNQIESWSAFSSSLFTPVSALFVTNKSYSLLQEESSSSGSIFFYWNFLKSTSAGLFHPILLVTSSCAASASFQLLLRALTQILESLDYRCPGFTRNGTFNLILIFAFVRFSVGEVFILEF